jgi:hypothetical protein
MANNSNHVFLTEEENDSLVKLLKIIFILVSLAIGLFFGYYPLFW